jgi:solute carrier family 35 protein F1/2
VICEKAVTEVGGNHEYLGCVGFFAACIAFFQATLLERQEISQFFGLFRADTDEQECSAEMSLGLLLLFLAFHVLGYYTSTKFLEVSESALLNISILTENVWSVIFSILVQHLIPSPFFYGALIFTVGGVYIYETAPPPIVHDDQQGIEDQDGALEMQHAREDQKRGYAKASTSSDRDLEELPIQGKKMTTNNFSHLAGESSHIHATMSLSSSSEDDDEII